MDRSPEEPQGGAAREPLGADFIIPVLACALTAYYFASTVDLVWEAKATGIFIGVVLVAMCAVHLARLGLAIAARRGSFGFGELVNNDLFNRQRLGLLGLVILFIVTIQWVGTTLGLFLLIVGCMLVMGVRSVRALIGAAFTTAATVYVLLIYLLGSRLPKGVIENLLALVLGTA